MRPTAIFHLQHFQLLRERCGWCVVRATDINVVSRDYIQTIRFAHRNPCPWHIWRFPFDWKSSCGYLIAVGIQCAIMLYATMLGVCIIAFPVGSYLYVMAMVKCINKMLITINQLTKDHRKKYRIFQQLVEFIQFHTYVKQLSVSCECEIFFFTAVVKLIFFCSNLFRIIIAGFWDVFKHICNLLFIWSLVTVCGTLLLVQTELVRFYSMRSIHFSTKKNNHFFSNFDSATFLGQASGAVDDNGRMFLYIRCFVSLLWYGPTRQYCVWEMQWYVQSIGMVSISGWNSTNATNYFKLHTATGWLEIFWEPGM